MKVKITADSKKIIRMYQVDVAKRIVKSLAEDEMSAADYAVYAVNAIMASRQDGCDRILECTAEIAGNGRAWNSILEDSENLDVWISGIARTYTGYVEFGAYLTDIWNLTGEDDEAEYMYSAIYTRDR